MKPPIWERQGRPKPPRVDSMDGILYAASFQRPGVCRLKGGGGWAAEVTPTLCYVFPTFAEAVAFADRVARR